MFDVQARAAVPCGAAAGPPKEVIVRTRPFPRARGPVGAIVAAALVIGLAACQSLSGSGSGSDGGDVGSPGGDLPTGDASTPVLVVRVAGGFVPMGFDFSAMPTLAVYGDGSVVVPGPQTLVFPGPALPNLQVAHLSPADLAGLVGAAADAGLLGAAPDYGMPNVTDLPTTYVSLTVDGQAYGHAAYALGFGDGDDLGGDVGGDVALPDTGLTQQQLVARRALTGFLDRATALVGADYDTEPYPVTALAVMAQEAEPAGEGQAGDRPEQVSIPWPLDGVALADVGRCGVVDGADAATLLEALAQANQATTYTQDGVTYGVWFRPLLPHEHGCADLGERVVPL